jgi:quercetin dioxygenase-like cupin family protein
MITRRDVLIAAVAACVTASVVTFAQTKPKPLMDCAVFDWEKIPVSKTQVGERRQFFDSESATMSRLTCHVTTLNPGLESHAPHKHPQEEVIIVKEGLVESVQEGVTNRVGAGSVIFQASNKMHGIRNVGDKPATYFVLNYYTQK